MHRTSILGAGLALFLLSGAPASAAYYEWSTNRPFSGFLQFGRHSLYCDYIRYPIRKCDHDRYGNPVRCRVVGWNVRQHCSR